jgi:hypothetical protein
LHADHTNRDPATATAVAAAQAGLKAAGDSIKDIALALVTGKAPPADSRTGVSQGLNDTRSALESITKCVHGSSFPYDRPSVLFSTTFHVLPH